MNLEFKKYHFKTVGSTNDYASQLSDDFPIVVVTADEQNFGRGRNGKVWFGSAGENIYMSIGLNHSMLVEQQIENSNWPRSYGYQMLSAMAIAKTLRQFSSSVFKLKYPNDVYGFSIQKPEIKGKIAGIITEHVFKGSTCTKTVIGIGVNINQNKFENVIGNVPVSMRTLEDSVYDLDGISNEIINNVDYYIYRGQDEIFSEWKNELGLVGEPIKELSTGKQLKVEDISKEGRLICNELANEKDRILIDNGNSIRYGDFND
jgi:BirA family biotin operon repressor/biotin-[acetyl-CoA-carboxylase] ligase